MGYYVDTAEREITIKKDQFDNCYKAMCKLNDNDDVINTNFILMNYIDGINLYQLNECDKKPYLVIILILCRIRVDIKSKRV